MMTVTMHMYYDDRYYAHVLLCPYTFYVHVFCDPVTMHMYYCDRYYAHVLL